MYDQVSSTFDISRLYFQERFHASAKVYDLLGFTCNERKEVFDLCTIIFATRLGTLNNTAMDIDGRTEFECELDGVPFVEEPHSSLTQISTVSLDIARRI